MIVKGRARSGPAQLASYLLRDDGKEHPVLVQLLDGGDSLHKAFVTWDAIGEATRGDKTLYHAQIAPDARYEMTPAQWLRAAEILAQELGMADHPRAIVVHDGGKNPHAHVVFQRTNTDTMTMWDDSFNFPKHSRASARMEQEFGHELVPDKHAKRDREKQPEPPKAELTTDEAQQAARVGMSKAERVAEITALRAGADNGPAFKNALEDAGYTLTQGERGYVLVQGGEVYALSRYVEGMKAKEIKAFMADVPLDNLPKTEDVQEAQKQALREQQLKKTAEPAPAPTPAPVEAPANDQKRGVEASKFLTAQPAEKSADPKPALKDPEIAALEKAITERQQAEMAKWQAWHAQELKQTAYVLDRGVTEKMVNYDAVQQAAKDRLARQHKEQEADIWERIQRRVNPAAAAEKARARQKEAVDLQRRQAQERKDYLALQIQTKQQDLDALKERHDQKERDVRGGFPAERERYLKDQAQAQRMLAELQEQRRQEEDRLRRDGPEPPIRVR